MRKTLIFLSVFLLAALLFATARLLGFNGLYGQDAHEYLRYAKELHDHFATAQAPPDFPPVYPAMGAVLGSMVGVINALQLISIISFALTLIVAYRIIHRLFPISKRTGYYLVAFGFLSPYFLRIGVCSMSDSLAGLLLVSTLYFVIIFYRNNQLKYFALALVTACMGVLTRYAIAIPVSIMFLCLLILKIRRENLLLNIKMLGAAVVPAILMAVSCKAFLLQAVSHPLVSQISLLHLFKSSFNSADGQANYTLPNALFMFYPFVHPGFIFIGPVLFFVWIRGIVFTDEVLLCLLPCAAYLLFLGLLPVQNIRLQTLVFPLVLILYAPAFAEVCRVLPFKRVLLQVAVAVQIVMTVFALRPIFAINRVEREIAAYLKPLSGRYHTLYELGSEGIVQSYQVNIRPVSLYENNLSGLQDSSLLLIQTEAFKKQWAGQLPEANYRFIQAHSTLIKLSDFKDGWSLYAVLRNKE